MHPRRFSTFLIGIWVAGLVLLFWISRHNLQVDQLMKGGGPKAQNEYQIAEWKRAHTLLLHQASELNRHYSYNWELAQLALGVVLAVNLLFATNGNRLMMTLCVSLLALTAIQHTTFTPQMIELGRGIDFALPDEMFDERRTLRGFQSYYLWLDVVKLLVLAGLTVRLLFGHSATSGRRRRRKHVEAVDDADHTHVNR